MLPWLAAAWTAVCALAAYHAAESDWSPTPTLVLVAHVVAAAAAALPRTRQFSIAPATTSVLAGVAAYVFRPSYSMMTQLIVQSSGYGLFVLWLLRARDSVNVATLV